jgi:hypothetical protein
MAKLFKQAADKEKLPLAPWIQRIYKLPNRTPARFGFVIKAFIKSQLPWYSLLRIYNHLVVLSREYFPPFYSNRRRMGRNLTKYLKSQFVISSWGGRRRPPSVCLVLFPTGTLVFPSVANFARVSPRSAYFVLSRASCPLGLQTPCLETSHPPFQISFTILLTFFLKNFPKII